MKQMGVAARVAAEQDIEWTPVDDVKPGDSQFWADRIVTISRISHLGRVKRFHYTTGDFRDWPVRQEVAIRRPGGSE